MRQGAVGQAGQADGLAAEHVPAPGAPGAGFASCCSWSTMWWAAGSRAMQAGGDRSAPAESSAARLPLMARLQVSPAVPLLLQVAARLEPARTGATSWRGRRRAKPPPGNRVSSMTAHTGLCFDGCGAPKRVALRSAGARSRVHCQTRLKQGTNGQQRPLCVRATAAAADLPPQARHGRAVPGGPDGLQPTTPGRAGITACHTPCSLWPLPGSACRVLRRQSRAGRACGSCIAAHPHHRDAWRSSSLPYNAGRGPPRPATSWSYPCARPFVSWAQTRPACAPPWPPTPRCVTCACCRCARRTRTLKSRAG